MKTIIIIAFLMQGIPMKLKLYRYEQTTKGIFGVMVIGNNRFKSVERPYKNNEPFISSVPAGTYTLVPHSSAQPHIGETWALVNHDLGVYQYADPKAKRTAILIHVANRPSELAGCIGLGKHLGFVRKELAVTSSRIAVGQALDAMSKDKKHTLEIINQF